MLIMQSQLKRRYRYNGEQGTVLCSHSHFPHLLFLQKRKSIFSFLSEYHLLTTNTLRNYFIKKEGFFKTFVVLILRCRKSEKD